MGTTTENDKTEIGRIRIKPGTEFAAAVVRDQVITQDGEPITEGWFAVNDVQAPVYYHDGVVTAGDFTINGEPA
ncbi:hypothetical protein [Kocuria massiliensis]|uniref:hypothetical protein n=1 Tax=Kocuria massiliensis TaxID=1926282 RepID=UPI0022B960BB|nr:hypothetical protein [Kocuria massiliensis]